MLPPDYSVNIYQLAGIDQRPASRKSGKNDDSCPAKKLAAAAIKHDLHERGVDVFPGDGLSSHFTARRHAHDRLPLQHGRRPADLLCRGRRNRRPFEKVATHISLVTDKTWQKTYWTHGGLAEYMQKWLLTNSFGLIGADMITLNAMLRIPVAMHNIAYETLPPDLLGSLRRR